MASPAWWSSCRRFVAVVTASLASWAVATAANIDLSGHAPAAAIRVVPRGGDALRVEWDGGDSGRCAVEIDLTAGRPLFRSLQIAPGAAGEFATLATDVHLRHEVIIGSRGLGERGEGDGPYVFFDKVDTRDYEKVTAQLVPGRVQVVGEGPSRTRVTISGLSAGTFSGDLVLTFYDGSPLIHLVAALAPEAPKVAYLYETLLGGTFPAVVFKSNTTDRFVTERPAKLLSARKVRSRTIMAEAPAGTVALFPPPHAFIYPMDFSDNLGFVQLGREGDLDLLGLKSHPRGDHRFRPWIDAPQGRTQHMACLLLLSPLPAAETFERVLAYTRGDSFKQVPGHVSLATHFHAALTVTADTENPENFRRTMMGLNVQAVALAEFHGDGHAKDTGSVRLDELTRMFEVCRRFSVPGRFTLIPGEESNAGFPGHTMYMFPKPVSLTLKRQGGQPFRERLPEYGDVYHVGDLADMLEVLRANDGLVWTAHPRIKASHDSPDRFFDSVAFRDDVFAGGGWKAMPLDLSEDRLGVRSLRLLDDMNRLGARKRLIGEVDVFKIDPTHELYAHMNVNYVEAAAVPPATDWSSLHAGLRDFRYFTTTGEVLIPAWSVAPDRRSVSAEIEWTFPLAFAEVVWGEGTAVKRAGFPLLETTELPDAARSFTWSVDLVKAEWVRLEVWDICRNGAFTPTRWR
jgi:hypothetical protein